MHVSELSELAAVVAIHAPELIRGEAIFPTRAMERYWTVSRCRLDRWARRLRAAEHQVFLLPAAANQHQALVEEILASEVLTRVWVAMVSAHDRQQRLDESEPLARNIYLGHQEARNKVLRWLVHGPHLSLQQLDGLNTLRRRMERWTDSLLAHFAPLVDISPWVFDHERAADFTQDLADNPNSAQRCTEIVTTAIRSAVLHSAQPHSPCGDLNQQIASAVLSCLPSTCVTAEEFPLRLWLERMGSTADATQTLLDELYQLEGTRFEWRP